MGIKKWRENLLIPESGRKMDFYDGGLIVAVAYRRVVIGWRGPYIEFGKEDLVWNSLFMPGDQEWRQEEEWRGRVFYLEWRTREGGRMVYEQLREVGYADYRVGMYYMSPWDLRTIEKEKLIEGEKPREAR